MKLRLFALILFFPFLAVARHTNPFSQEDLSIFQHVNVITGNLNISSEDDPLLGAYPITIHRTYTSAGALERGYHNTHHLLTKVLRGQNKIFYNKAEIVMTKPYPHTDIRDPNNSKTEMTGGGPKVKLLDLMEEPYEDCPKNRKKWGGLI